MGVAGRAAQVLEWDRAHRFCGVCGTPTEAQASERSRACPACGHVAYPRLSPAMMALVWRGDELLLARSPHYAPGMFSALAGFVEAGESLEECVHREVAEEVGVRVRNLRYYGSQSWPFPHSLMVAFSADGTAATSCRKKREIEAAGWYRGRRAAGYSAALQHCRAPDPRHRGALAWRLIAATDRSVARRATRQPCVNVWARPRWPGASGAFGTPGCWL